MSPSGWYEEEVLTTEILGFGNDEDDELDGEDWDDDDWDDDEEEEEEGEEEEEDDDDDLW